ncbi:hypothetical protein SAMN03159353_1006104 [Cedecea sp. NFIX57]|nr:hypothetical protein SAMN03159353_1006104 [Cedecea sp. NFIX57]
MDQDDPEEPIFVYTLNVLLKDVNGKTYNISKTPDFYNKANAPVDINVECQIPANITAGAYEMFIYIDELFFANGESGEYVKGLTLDIVDKVDITIL